MGNLLLSNYKVPSFVKRGDLLLIVSTAAKSLAVSRKIKQDLGGKYDETYDEYLNLFAEVRELSFSYYQDSNIRRGLVRQLIIFDLEELN